MATPPRHGTAEEVLRAIRVRWPILVVFAVVGALLAWLVGSMQPKRYRASTVAAVVPRAELMPAEDQIRGIQALDQRTIVATVAALPELPSIADSLTGGHGYAVRAVVLPNTNLLRIDVDGADPKRAAAIANAVPALLAARTKSIFGLYGVTTVSTASGGELVFPRIERIVAAGLVIGLIIGLTIAWILTAAARPPAPAS